jgi:phenylalanyl-tRNA synthetase alpha chain
MIEEVKKHLNEVDAFSSKDVEAIEKFRLNYAGKKRNFK